jgi:hypothetical protein
MWAGGGRETGCVDKFICDIAAITLLMDQVISVLLHNANTDI